MSPAQRQRWTNAERALKIALRQAQSVLAEDGATLEARPRRHRNVSGHAIVPSETQAAKVAIALRRGGMRVVR